MWVGPESCLSSIFLKEAHAADPGTTLHSKRLNSQMASHFSFTKDKTWHGWQGPAYAGCHLTQQPHLLSMPCLALSQVLALGSIGFYYSSWAHRRAWVNAIHSVWNALLTLIYQDPSGISSSIPSPGQPPWTPLARVILFIAHSHVKNIFTFHLVTNNWCLYLLVEQNLHLGKHFFSFLSTSIFPALSTWFLVLMLRLPFSWK